MNKILLNSEILLVSHSIATMLCDSNTKCSIKATGPPGYYVMIGLHMGTLHDIYSWTKEVVLFIFRDPRRILQHSMLMAKDRDMICL